MHHPGSALPATSADPEFELDLEAFDLVVFDCDGVIVDSEMLAAECLAELLTSSGRRTALGDVFERYLGRSMAVVAADFREAVGRPLPATFPAELAEALRRRFEAGLAPIAGIAEVLETLRRPFCLASSSGPERIALSLRLTGLDRHFEGRIFEASMVRQGKPAPDLFLLAAERMGADPVRTLVIEDSVSGVRAGKAAGMTVWGFTGGSHHAHMDGAALLAQAGADLVFRDMSRLKRNGTTPRR